MRCLMSDTHIELMLFNNALRLVNITSLFVLRFSVYGLILVSTTSVVTTSKSLSPFFKSSRRKFALGWTQD